MTARAWTSGSRRPCGLPVDFGSDGYGWMSRAIHTASLSASRCGSRRICRKSLHRGADLCARALIGGHDRLAQRGQESDRRIGPGTLAQPLEHADVRLQQPPPRFVLAPTTEQPGDRLVARSSIEMITCKFCGSWAKSSSASSARWNQTSASSYRCWSAGGPPEVHESTRVRLLDIRVKGAAPPPLQKLHGVHEQRA